MLLHLGGGERIQVAPAKFQRAPSSVSNLNPGKVGRIWPHLERHTGISSNCPFNGGRKRTTSGACPTDKWSVTGSSTVPLISLIRSIRGSPMQIQARNNFEPKFHEFVQSIDFRSEKGGYLLTTLRITFVPRPELVGNLGTILDKGMDN